MKNERKRILKMVQEGKLTVDEALLLLEEFEKSNKTMEQKQEQLISELSTVVDFEQSQKSESTYQKTYSAKDKFFDFVDTAFKKIKDFDLDFNFGSYVEVSHIFQHGSVDLQSIDIDIPNGKVKLIPWDQNDVRVECQAKVYRVEKQEEAREVFLRNVSSEIRNNRFQFAVEQKWIKLDTVIYVPQAQYEKVKIRMFNGPFESENIQARDFDVKTANGKIDINGINSVIAELETGNGNIIINNGMLDKLEAETVNGLLELNGEVRKAELQAFSGNIVCSLKSCEDIDIKATTGNVELSVPENLPLHGVLKSNLGSLHVDLNGLEVVEEKNEIVQKQLRFKPLVESGHKVYVSADSKTGSITIKRVT